jgi:hypothetical protein
VAKADSSTAAAAAAAAVVMLVVALSRLIQGTKADQCNKAAENVHRGGNRYR